MAALNTLAPIGLVSRRAARRPAARRTAFRRRNHLGVATPVWAAIAAVLACLWMALALGFSLLVLVGLLVEWAN
jgi:hypothetical protein